MGVASSGRRDTDRGERGRCSLARRETHSAGPGGRGLLERVEFEGATLTSSYADHLYFAWCNCCGRAGQASTPYPGARQPGRRELQASRRRRFARRDRTVRSLRERSAGARLIICCTLRNGEPQIHRLHCMGCRRWQQLRVALSRLGNKSPLGRIDA